MPFPYLDEALELNETTRRAAGGSFIALSNGVTHYELSGDSRGKTVVLVHGFSVPYFIFDLTFEFLVGSGFRVLRYDLFGRGLSDRPPAAYNIQLFVNQLEELLKALELKDINLLGLSMGGPITAAFIDQHPHYVQRHVLIDPAGAKRIRLPWLLEALKLPLIGELALGLFGSGTLIKGIASDLFDPELVGHFQDQYKVQMQYIGFKRALLSSMRSKMLESFYEIYARIGKFQKPTLLFWGKNDTTVPYADSAILLRVLPQAEFHAIENCGHIPHYEKPAIVNPILLGFLSRP